MRPETQRLLEALDAHGWNRGATAAALRISRSTLWRRMKEYGLA
jgi:transcriptional regulator of acetoin/glycerol metabolism